MGSSTADIVAAVRALADAMGRKSAAEMEAEVATWIESSARSMYPGIVAFEQKAGRIVREFSGGLNS